MATLHEVGHTASMAQRNPAREIAFSLIAALVLGTGFYFYLKSTMPTEESIKAGMKMLAPSASPSGSASGSAGTPDPGPGIHERASNVAQRFVTALREKRYADARALTTNAYQRAVSLAEFQAAIESTPYMATAQEVSFVRVSQQTMIRESGEPALGPVMGRGMLISGNGNVDVSVTLTHEDGSLRVLTFIAAGIPIFKGMVATP